MQFCDINSDYKRIRRSPHPMEAGFYRALRARMNKDEASLAEVEGRCHVAKCKGVMWKSNMSTCAH